MVLCSLTEVLKDDTASPVSAPSSAPVQLLGADIRRLENAPYMRIVSDSRCCTVPAELLSRTALQRVLMSLNMSSTESEDSVSYPSSSRRRLQEPAEAFSAQGTAGSTCGSLTVISFWKRTIRIWTGLLEELIDQD